MRKKYTNESFVKAIKEFTSEWGFPPTIRDLQLMLGVSSTSVVKYHLSKLRYAGIVLWEEGKARSIRIKQVPNSAG